MIRVKFATLVADPQSKSSWTPPLTAVRRNAGLTAPIFGAMMSRAPRRQDPQLSCPVKSAFETQVRVHAFHQHRVGNRVLIEAIIATPLEGGEYALEEFLNISDLLGLVGGVLAICTFCKRVRDDQGAWRPLEGYLHEHTGAGFSHGLCAECFAKHYPEFSEDD